jgi:PAS domain S-box-containing protein
MSKAHPDKQVAKSLLVNAVMSASNGITIADARKRDMPLIFVNDAFERMTGYSAKEVVGTNCRFLQGKAKRQRALETVRCALKEHESCNVILRNYRKDGTLFWNELYLAPIRNADEVTTHYIGIQSDVTRRVEAERAEARLKRELRARNRELRKLNEQKSALLGMAAHDIRNPLSAILLNAELLGLNEKKGNQKNPQSRAVERIRQQAQFMLDMVNELLDVTAIESGKLELNFRPCSLRDLIQERLPVYRQSASAKGITVRSHCATRLPDVLADGSRIAQVLDNLVSNAVKFSPSGAAVAVKTQREDDTVRVDVVDRGQGIPEEELSKLFLPFSTTSVKSTAGEASTGLGLAICHKIIQGHPGGWIGVQSKMGKGSTFSFRLPIHQEKKRN